MTASRISEAGQEPLVARTPPLENGDRMTRAEFERRYDSIPHLKKAELIEGVVHVPSPVRFHGHGNPQFLLITWLGTYQAATPGVLGGDNSTARMDLDNEPQPDVLMLLDPAWGGQAAISADDFVEGAPELVCEIAASSASYDLHTKLNVYRRNGVREYLVWRVHDRIVDWFALNEGQFTPLPSEEGLMKSRVFPGLWLDTDALLRGDMPRVLAVVQQGIATPEHVAFVAALNRPTSNP